jgi:DNA-binding NarL/FixJ family response regulator
MAAEGLTTPAIAQALFVTTKTVETHLGHAYQSSTSTLVTSLASTALTFSKRKRR